MDQGSRPARLARRSGDYVTRRIAGETLVVPIRAEAAELDSIYLFNEVGARVWDLLESGSDEAAVVQTIVEEFEVLPERARADLESFLAQLSEAGLLELGSVA
jgi:hypothetical protein